MKEKIVADESCFSKIRLDTFISKKLDISRSRVQSAISKGDVTVNNKLCDKASYIVNSGDEIIFELQIAETKIASQEKKDLKIVFEDEYLLVVNKDSNLVVHPGHGNKENTLINYLYGYLGYLPFLVNRLDKDTSGLLVVAKNESIHQSLQGLWKGRQVEKKYKALVLGGLDSFSGKIEAPISRDKYKRIEMNISSSSSAKNAITEFQTIDVFSDTTFLDIKILTGRTHQIRVHFKSIKHPVIGDNVYGDKKINLEYKQEYGLSRQFLHSYGLHFIHPITRKEMDFDIELADDLQDVINQKKVEVQL